MLEKFKNIIVVKQKGNKEVDSQIVVTFHTQAETPSIRHSKTLITLHQNKLVKHQNKLTKLQKQE